MEEPCNSPTSSIDSSSYASLSSGTSHSRPHNDLTTELKLGLSLSSSTGYESSSSRDEVPGWPPIRSGSRSQFAARRTFFIKVYMEGIPIGRKLDLFKQNGYNGLIRALQDMFGTSILCNDLAQIRASNNNHVLTYEDKEGDWMMVGDVPWEIFLNNVKRLKITRIGNY